METTFYSASPWVEVVADGTFIPIVGIVMGGLLMIVVACGIMCLMFLKTLTGGGTTRDRRKLEKQEALAFQDLERGFRRMEERLDSLETLLIGRSNRPASSRELREL